jgi:hypothetical protein
MAFLHIGDQKQTTIFSFNSCRRDFVFLEGLTEGETIRSTVPYFFQNANGYLAIDDRFTTLQVIKNSNVVQTINITWNRTCAIQAEIETSGQNAAQEHQASFRFGIDPMMVLLAGIMVIAISRRFFNAKN